jgi:hypothetical protein
VQERDISVESRSGTLVGLSRQSLVSVSCACLDSLMCLCLVPASETVEARVSTSSQEPGAALITRAPSILTFPVMQTSPSSTRLLLAVMLMLPPSCRIGMLARVTGHSLPCARGHSLPCARDL